MIITLNAFYLTINYTDTFEDYQNISPDNILHIHGRESIGDPLIFGHAGNYEHISSGTEMDIPNPPDSITIYGLSLSPVDMPYLQHIVSHCDEFPNSINIQPTIPGL